MLTNVSVMYVMQTQNVTTHMAHTNVHARKALVKTDSTVQVFIYFSLFLVVSTLVLSDQINSPLFSRFPIFFCKFFFISYLTSFLFIQIRMNVFPLHVIQTPNVTIHMVLSNARVSAGLMEMDLTVQVCPYIRHLNRIKGFLVEWIFIALYESFFCR